MFTGVRSCYDEGKRTAETLTMDYHRGAGVEVLSLSLTHLFLMEPNLLNPTKINTTITSVILSSIYVPNLMVID